jgi:hypothetical protein
MSRFVVVYLDREVRLGTGDEANANSRTSQRTPFGRSSENTPSTHFGV